MLGKKNQLLLICFLVSLGLVIFYNFDPANSSNIYPPSLTREWGGFYCAGCGTLRAIHQLLHGNWQAALRLNPLLVIALPYCLYWVVPYFFRYFYQINLYSIQYKNKQVLATAIACIAYGIMRNMPHPALSWLVPPN